MKKTFTKIALIAAVAALGFSGCKKEEKVDCADVSAELQKVLDLDEKYMDAPTIANCNAAKKAALDFLDKFKKCSGSDAAQFDEAMSEIKNDPCTEESIKEQTEEDSVE